MCYSNLLCGCSNNSFLGKKLESQTKQGLLKTAMAFGLQPTYYDIWGKEHTVPKETLEAIIKAMGHCVEDASGPKLSTELICKKGQKGYRMSLSIPDPTPKHPIHWEIKVESGKVYQGMCLPSGLELLGQEKRGGSSFWLPLAPELDEGYHRISISYGGLIHESLLILPPRTCYLPWDTDEKEKIFGLMVQLYSLRSEGDLGIGDLKGLSELAFGLREYNIRCIGLNPLHALFPHQPEAKSPYSPSTRLFFNPIYVALDKLPEFASCEKGARILEECENLIKELKSSELVEYGSVWELKKRLFRELYAQFKKRKDSQRMDAFNTYKLRKGQLLDFFATFQALNVYFKESLDLNTWHYWPESFQDPGSSKVQEWKREHWDELEFYKYLAWIIEEALLETKKALNSMDMLLYLDLPVGVDSSGFETWYFKGLFAKDISIGAPPDLFNPKGQDWGLPPVIPQALYKDSFEYFIKTIRSNMEKADILRLDHIMGLARLFWIPKGMKPFQGAYVTYPMEELFAILALESHRNKCVVVGEDLGTVPDEVREAMEEYNVLSYSVFIFEKTEDRFKLPNEYKRKSVSTITTHDLPTLKGFWEGEDIKKRSQLGLFDDQELQNLYIETRKKDKEMILELLDKLELIPEGYEKNQVLENFSFDFAFWVHKVLMLSNSLIVIFQIEDMIGEIEQKNLPGTIFEYPNWSRKLSLDINRIFEHPLFKRILRKIKGLYSTQ